MYAQGKWTRAGDELYEKGNYAEAIELYEWAQKRNEGELAVAGLGMSYYKLKQVQKACEIFAQLDFSELDLPDLQLLYARALMGQKKYGEAMGQVLPVLSRHPDHAQARSLLTACQNSFSLLADPAQFTIEKVPFNTPVSDFSPVPFEEGVVFATSLDGRVAVNYTSPTHGRPLVDLYFVPKQDSGKWGKAKPLKGAINTRFNDGPACFNPAGDRIYFTRNNFLDGKRGFSNDKINKLKLFTGRWEEKEGWVDISEMPINNDDYSVGHPSLSSDGKTLFFISDREDGFGGTDLYRVDLKGDTWGEPKNLGPSVNTPGNEMFPFIHGDGNLYFASDGHPGLGGLDVYSALVTEDGTGAVNHLGIPVNSAFDDFSLTLDSTGKSGYFCSNRGEDPLNDDIYALKVLWPEFDCFPQQEANLCFTFSEGGTIDTNDPANAGLQYQWDFGDDTYKKGLEVDHCFPSTGEYRVRLNLIDSVSEFIFMNEAEYLLQVSREEEVYIEGPDAVLPGDPIDINGLGSVVPDCEIKEYYWDLGDGRRRTGATVALAYEQAGQYEVHLGVIGRTKEGRECKACSTRVIQVLKKQDLVTYMDSVARQKELDEGGPLLAKEEVIESNGPKTLPNIETITTRKFSLIDYDIDVYRVQIAQSDTQIPTDSSFFKGLNDISEFPEEDHFVYTIGAEKEPVKLYPLYKQAIDLEFEATIVAAFKGDEIVNGHDSTYFIKFPQSSNPHNVSVVRGKLTDMDGNPIQANIKWDDLTKGKIFASTTSTKDGRYYMKLPNGTMYGITAELDDYFTFSDIVDLRGTTNSTEFVGDIKVISIEDMIESGKAYTLKNIFFDYDHYTLRPESNKSLDRLARILIENEGLKVEIRGHTDSRGDDNYNLRLSKRRASEVLKYLILSGYNVDNIISNGYGETLPIANNDSPEGRQLNRRVEFKFFKENTPAN